MMFAVSFAALLLLVAFVFITLLTVIFLCYSSTGSKRWSYGVIKDVTLAESPLILFPFAYLLNCYGYFMWGKSEHFDELRLYDPVLNAMIYRGVNLVEKYGSDEELVHAEYGHYLHFYLEKKYTVDMNTCTVNDTRVILTPLLLRKLKKLIKELDKKQAHEKAKNKVGRIIC